MAPHWAEITLEQILEAFELTQADRPTPELLTRLGNMLRDTLQQTGEILMKKGKRDLAEYIWGACVRSSTAAQLTQCLVEDFPAFADVHHYKNHTIHIVKKAQ